MNLSLAEILSYYSDSISFECDYNKKIRNGCYKLEEEQISIETIIEYLVKGRYLDSIIGELKSTQKDKLFNSITHGYYHNERVLLIGFIIGKLRNIDDVKMKILMDASKYHDIGRRNDLVDDAHGLVGANMIQKIIKDDPFYQNKDYLNILKCVIDFHSTNDMYKETMLETYEIEDKVSAIELMNILKDSDGLDRVRISMGYNSSKLDPNYLRLNESRSLVKFAHQLNELYLYALKKTSHQDELDKLYESFNGDMFLHGIGFDFFKLESILKDGILSKNELSKRNILSSKNFDGYNYEDYISVSCYGNEYYSNNNAYNMHVRGRFAFCIGGVEAFEGEKSSGISEHDFRTRKLLFPIDIGVFPDERFVRDEISTEKIKTVLIPKSIMSLRLSDLTYMTSSLSLETIQNKINYYISIVEKKTNSQVNRQIFDDSIEKIKTFETRYRNGGLRAIDYEERVFQELRSTNSNIGALVNNMYQGIFGKEDVRLEDVVKDIMDRNNLSISATDDNYLYINLGETKKLE